LEKPIEAPTPVATAADLVKLTELKKEAAIKAALEAKLVLEPFSIYISRATRKLYLRRNTHKRAPDGGGEVFDSSIELPIAIANPEKRIGTHVFTAVARTDAGLQWTAVTIDHSDDPKNALERITIPPGVLERTASLASVRSSIIISDEPLSSETNYRTEFVAVLSNQPQGGFATRLRWDELVVSGNVWDGANVGTFLQRGSDSQSRNTRPRRGQYD
jgi:hypothetical protein